jgi:hypothetical protein
MRKLPLPVLPSTHPRQLSMALDAATLRGVSPSERRTALTQLAIILMEAAGVVTEERSDDER